MSKDNYQRDWYDRPNNRWSCGRAAEGCPCSVGPSRQGKCQNTAVCEPITNENGWTCTRSATLGGPCEQGPFPDGTCCQQQPPCVPVKSVRRRRQIFVTGCVMLVVGSLLLGLSRPERNQLISAGTLSSHHASIAQGKDCATCHEASEQTVAQWVGSLVGWSGNKKIDPETHFSQTDKCIECHKDKFEEKWARSPHNLDPVELAHITQTKNAKDFRFQDLFGAMQQVSHNLDCATCHREHQGPHHDLQAMTNQQCQSCHAESFDSFAHGHPEFGSWPYQRRTRIAFDHVSHQSLHFKEKMTEFNCNRCHLDDASQVSKPLAGFDQACASCHERAILDQSKEGVPLLALPTIDVELLRKQGISVGTWPKQADGVFDGVIPPLMQILISTDEEVSAALGRLGPEVDLSIVDEADEQQLRDVATVSIAIRDLMEDLRVNGTEGAAKRFSLAAGLDKDASLKSFIDRTPPELFQAVAEAWFPTRERTQGSTASLEPSQLRIADVIRNQKPIQDREVAQVQFQLEQTVRQDERAPRNSLRESSDEWQNDFESFLDERAVMPGILTGFPTAQDRERLIENPLKGMLSQSQGAGNSSSSNNGNSPNLGQDPAGSQGTSPSPTQNRTEPKTTANPEITSQQNPSVRSAESERSGGTRFDEPRQPKLPSGRWGYEELSMTLSYHPDGHADALLKEWIDYLAAIPESDRSTSLEVATNSLLGDLAPGRCTDCHSVDSLDSALLEYASLDKRVDTKSQSSASSKAWLVNWNAEQRSPLERGFTRFSHRPHLIQPSLNDCSACHMMDREADVKSHYDDRDPLAHRVGFLPIKKQTCVECHHQQTRTDQCTTCHNYHVQSH